MAAPFVSMLLLGAGRGTRLGGDVPKGWLMLGGQSLIERCVRRLAQLAPKEQREIVLSVHDDDRARYLAPALAHLTQLGLTRVVSGGDTRQASMRNALAACDPRGEIVLVHDAARPFFPIAAAVQTIAKSATCGGALLAVPTPDTLKEVDGTHVLRTQPRERLWSAQTPQVARRDLLQRALDAATRDGFAGTDDVSLLERIGAEVHVVRGDSNNLKITSADDWALAEAIAARQDAAAMSVPVLPRIGLGIDLHRLEKGRRCVLGGVIIDSDVGPLGHSDGDAVLHALADAMLGAAGEPDLGTLFSDKDPKNAARDSADFVHEALARVRARNLRVVSVDVVVETERPKLKPHRDAIRTRLAALCGALPLDRVNVKGKTAEGLDAIGRGEALRATVVVLLA